MKNKKIIFGIITILWVCVIFSFSLQTGEESNDTSTSFLTEFLMEFLPKIFHGFESITQEQMDFLHVFIRKCAHFTEYLILGVFSTLTLLQTEWKRKYAIGIGFCATIAAMDETLQLFVSGRTGKVLDVFIDSAGATVGVMFVLFVAKYIRDKRKKQIIKGL